MGNVHFSAEMGEPMKTLRISPFDENHALCPAGFWIVVLDGFGSRR